MLKFSLSGRDQRIIIFSVGFIIVLNSILFLLPYLLPSANYTVDTAKKPEIIFQSADNPLSEIRYSDNYAYILNWNNRTLYKINLNDKSETIFPLSEYINSELLSNIHLVNVNDQGAFLTHFDHKNRLGVGEADQYFSYITDQGVEFTQYIFTVELREMVTSIPYATSFSINGKEILVYWDFIGSDFCEIQFYEIKAQIDHVLLHRQSFFSETQNSCSTVKSIYPLENTLLISTNYPNQDYESVYQFDPVALSFEEFDPFARFTSRAREIFDNQTDTYGYHDYFFVGGEM